LERNLEGQRGATPRLGTNWPAAVGLVQWRLTDNKDMELHALAEHSPACELMRGGVWR
jgi:hypothetical protein